jgi:hypothetical protein
MPERHEPEIVRQFAETGAFSFCSAIDALPAERLACAGQ